MSTVKKYVSILEILNFFFETSGCCYGYCDSLCDWWIWLTELSMIRCFNCPITSIRLKPTVQLCCPIKAVQNETWKNEAANAPITFEEIAMVMISAWIACSRHSVGKTKCDSKQHYSSREVKKRGRLGLSHSMNPT